MSVWNTIVGQQPVVDMLRGIAEGDPAHIAQSWLFCGPPGSGRSNVAIAFAAALECPRHGCGECEICRAILERRHPDVQVMATDKVTIGIDEVRRLVEDSEETPHTSPWRVIIIEDVDRMLERTTNVLLKEVEEPAEHTIWMLCAPSPQDVLPTIRSRTRLVTLAVPQTKDVAAFIEKDCGVDERLALRCARLSEGHIGIARLYAKDDQALADRDELVVGVLNLRRVSDAVVLADTLLKNAKTQAETSVERSVEREKAEFRRINGLKDKDPIPSVLRSQWNAIGKKEDRTRRATRLVRDVLDRSLNSIASIYRDVAVIQNGAVDAVGIVNLENKRAIYDLSARIGREDAVDRMDRIALTRRRLRGNGNAQLDFEALLCSLIVFAPAS
ncbi:DNA polymerase III subunit delta' [Pseudoscardovia radai]|uniref:DNA polymerase III subunit delta n=1 Tax=Pseudoscardovia radai TaxID=987066 RepID=A0A261EQE8_9BIFI|nr:DNA polymerase III subunit delta' [Pseudoscardovia radai]OZG48906.1 DNA polymerase III subunit delta' [Pseudoscardovia radai]